MFILSLRYVMKNSATACLPLQSLKFATLGWMAIYVFVSGAEVSLYEILNEDIDCPV
jgi:hypothetical protein